MTARYGLVEWALAALVIALVAMPAGRIAKGQGPGDWLLVVKPPSADTYVSSFVYEVGKEKVYPGPYGASEGLFVGNTYDRAFKIYGHGRAYLRFDILGVPAGAKILRAELRLFMYQAPKRELKYLAFRVLGPWDDKTMKWADQPPMADSPTAQAIVGTKAFVWVSWDITRDVELWIKNPSSNFGIALRIEEERDADGEIAAFDSKEGVHSVDGERAVPRLEIVYSGPWASGAVPLSAISTKASSSAMTQSVTVSTTKPERPTSTAVWTRSMASIEVGGETGDWGKSLSSIATLLAISALAIFALVIRRPRSARGRNPHPSI
ncbi:MAG: DNRLRE domain-containing protein [Candidatus Bathyarchaeia archaeon]